eukprot:TRINITY_DN1214_c0_g1_i1.p1 TRINITY_DN1214_c0_g1~~TRINITY_DN1214_c0_g1_i1.p1  ORF type:complete len:411 (-),score=71.85 TRINITY_DN1214_c0_g1_i1:83-1315(-)
MPVSLGSEKPPTQFKVMLFSHTPMMKVVALLLAPCLLYVSTSIRYPEIKPKAGEEKKIKARELFHLPFYRVTKKYATTEREKVLYRYASADGRPRIANVVENFGVEVGKYVRAQLRVGFDTEEGEYSEWIKIYGVENIWFPYKRLEPLFEGKDGRDESFEQMAQAKLLLKDAAWLNKNRVPEIKVEEPPKVPSNWGPPPSEAADDGEKTQVESKAVTVETVTATILQADGSPCEVSVRSEILDPARTSTEDALREVHSGAEHCTFRHKGPNRIDESLLLRLREVMKDPTKKDEKPNVLQLVDHWYEHTAKQPEAAYFIAKLIDWSEGTHYFATLPDETTKEAAERYCRLVDRKPSKRFVTDLAHFFEDQMKTIDGEEREEGVAHRRPYKFAGSIDEENKVHVDVQGKLNW